jgi:hypothetical protein
MGVEKWKVKHQRCSQRFLQKYEPTIWAHSIMEGEELRQSMLTLAFNNGQGYGPP